MTIITRIKNILPTKLLARGAGIVALGMVISDAHYVGKMQADLYASEKDAAAAMYYLNNFTQMTSMSKTQEKVKKLAFTTELDQTWRRFFNEGIGYIKGFTSMLGNHIIPLVLGGGALLGGSKVSKICAGGVGLYGAFEFVRNFFGIGVPQGIRFDK